MSLFKLSGKRPSNLGVQDGKLKGVSRQTELCL